jgi:hypothetical protein
MNGCCVVYGWYACKDIVFVSIFFLLGNKQVIYFYGHLKLTTLHN